MAETSLISTTSWTILAGLLILYAPQPSTFHEVDRRSILGDSSSIHYSDYVRAKDAQPRISLGRRQINSSSDEEDVSHAMWLSRYLSQPRPSGPHDAGPSSRPDQPECPVVTKRRRLDPLAKPVKTTAIRSFLDSSNWTRDTRMQFCKFVKRKVPETNQQQLTAIIRNFTGPEVWNYVDRENFLNGFFQDPPDGWDQRACEEYMRIYFQTVPPGWSDEQQYYIIERLLKPPPEGFNDGDREFYLEYFWLVRPQCWQRGSYLVFAALLLRNMPQGENGTYGALLECFIDAPAGCWSYEERVRFVRGFLQGPPYGMDQRQRLEFFHRLARTSPMNQYLHFRGGVFYFRRPQNVSSTLSQTEYYGRAFHDAGDF